MAMHVTYLKVHLIQNWPRNVLMWKPWPGVADALPLLLFALMAQVHPFQANT